MRQARAVSASRRHSGSPSSHRLGGPQASDRGRDRKSKSYRTTEPHLPSHRCRRAPGIRQGTRLKVEVLSWYDVLPSHTCGKWVEGSQAFRARACARVALCRCSSRHILLDLLALHGSAPSSHTYTNQTTFLVRALCSVYLCGAS